jgi:hypothetical protein
MKTIALEHSLRIDSVLGAGLARGRGVGVEES